MKHALITFCVEVEGEPTDECILRRVVPKHTDARSYGKEHYQIKYSDAVKPSIKYIEVTNETR